MGLYYSYYASVGRDPGEKHRITAIGIESHKTDSVFRASIVPFLVKWHRNRSVRFGPGLEITEEYVGSDGNGWMKLRDAAGEHTFYVHQRAADFIAEVKSHWR